MPTLLRRKMRTLQFQFMQFKSLSPFERGYSWPEPPLHCCYPTGPAPTTVRSV